MYTTLMALKKENMNLWGDTMKEKRMVIYCPVNGWDCPYWEKDGRCKLGVSVIDECDDFSIFWNPDEEFWIWEEEEE